MGFTVAEMENILHATNYFKQQRDLIVTNFEFSPVELRKNHVHGLCFIAISNKRWNEVHKKKLSWQDGNEAVLKSQDCCDVVITEEPIAELKASIIQLIVENSFLSLQILAKAAREKMHNPVIGITGSVGKSSTRLLMEHLLKDTKSIVATRGNHNTQSGVPLYGAKLCTNPDFGILEISLNALNNRGNQALTIKPSVTIVTSIGEAHLSTLYSTENIALFKARIFAGLEKNGLAVINADINRKEFLILLEEAKKRTNHIKTYSLHHRHADLYVKEMIHTRYRTIVHFIYNEEEYAFHMKLPSAGMVSNTLAGLLTLLELKFDINPILPKIEDFASLDKVMQLKKVTTKDGRKVEIIDDSHNAAVPSMINAIEMFNEKSVFYSGKKILVLGQVADLGEASELLHEKLLTYIKQSKADYVFGHGLYMRNVIKQLPKQLVGGWFMNAKTMSRHIPLYCTDDTLIVLKGSVTGSDFCLTSKYLPSALKVSDKKLGKLTQKEMADILQQLPCMTLYDPECKQFILSIGYTKTQSLEGLGAIILVYVLLEKGIRQDHQAPLKNWTTNKGKSIMNRRFITGEIFSDKSLFQELLVTQHPSAVFELASRYFNGRNKAMAQIVQTREKYNLASESALNLTGRYRVKEQQSYCMEDLQKLGILLQSHKDQLPTLFSNGINDLKGIVFGNIRLSMIAFTDHYILCANGFKSKSELFQLIQSNIYPEITGSKTPAE